MKRYLLYCLIFSFSLFAFACEEKVQEAKTSDPLEVKTYSFLEQIDQKKWEDAYQMLSPETRKYYPKETFIEWAENFILPKAKAVYVKKVEKRKLDATVFTEFKPKSSWATYNTLEQAKIKLNFAFVNGEWFIHMPEAVSKGKEEEAKEKARLERVAEYKKFIKLMNFHVENKITDEGPMLVFNGTVENTGEKTVEMVMVMVDFFDGKGKKIYNVVFVPIYISDWEGKEALKPKTKQEFQSSVSSKIPDTWTGKIDYYLFDAGDMPQQQ